MTASVALAVWGRSIGSCSGGIVTGVGIGFGLMLLALTSWPLLETSRGMLNSSIDEISNQDMPTLQPPPPFYQSPSPYPRSQSGRPHS